MRRSLRGPVLVSSLGLAFATAALSARADGEPTVDDVLRKSDEALFFFDKQDKLAGYDVELATNSTQVNSGKPSQAKPDKKVGKISYDATTGKKKQTDDKGADVPPGTFTPFCGPWTLTTVMTFELELFAQPFSTRFDAKTFDRSVETTGDDGFTLKLTPKEVIGEPFMLKPAITGIELALDKDGVPTKGTLHLDQKMMKEDGQLVFHFADVKGTKKKRIEKIENTLTSANLKITPTLTFTFSDKSGFALPALVEFRVPGVELSPTTMNGTDMITFLSYAGLKAKKSK